MASQRFYGSFDRLEVPESSLDGRKKEIDTDPSYVDAVVLVALIEIIRGAMLVSTDQNSSGVCDSFFLV